MTRDDAGIELPISAPFEEAIAKQDLIFKDTFPGMLGVRILEAAPGHCVATLEVSPSVKHPGGYAHGGALAGFGDTTAAWATGPSLNPGESFTTIEFKANFIAGVTGGRLRAEANAVHRGRRTMLLEVRITTDDDEGKTVAIMLVTQAILAPTAAAPAMVEIPAD